MQISKSNYVSYTNCKKSYWLNINKPEEKVISEYTKKILDTGNNIGDLAMSLFGDYIDVTTYNNDRLDLKMMSIKTKAEIDKGTINICEASFYYENLYCAVDILHKVDNGYEIYEVKSTTKVEDYHKKDVAFQKYVLTKLGYNIINTYVVTLNPNYIREDELDISQLFKKHNINDDVAILINDVYDNILDMIDIQNIDYELPSILNKNCLTPHECMYKNYCFKDIKSPNVFELSNCRKKFDYYNENIISFNDLFNSKYYNKLTKNNKDQVDFELLDKVMYVDKNKIKQFLNTITYPLYLLDFETYMPAIPQFKGMKCYQQIPFQYSLHIIDKFGNITHKEFLAKDGINPTYDLAISLINDIPSNSCIMAYNMAFEITRIKELALMYPSLANKLNNLLTNFIDLMIPFKNHDIYKKEFKGSYSIKYILPGLFPNDPELDYHNLDIIHNGSEAMSIFENLSNYNEDDKQKIRQALLKYCELDTYAMVKILNYLIDLVK